MSNDIKIPKYILTTITFYTKQIQKLRTPTSNWNYLMCEMLEASLKGQNCIEYWSDYDYESKKMVENIQKHKYDLIEHGYQVRIETKDYKNREEPVILANVSWNKNIKEN